MLSMSCDSGDAEGPSGAEPAVLHDGEPGGMIVTAHQAVERIGQTVDMERTGDQYGDRDEQERCDGLGQGDQDKRLVRVDQQESDEEADKREIGHGFRQVPFLDNMAFIHRHDRQEL